LSNLPVVKNVDGHGTSISVTIPSVRMYLVDIDTAFKHSCSCLTSALWALFIYGMFLQALIIVASQSQ